MVRVADTELIWQDQPAARHALLALTQAQYVHTIFDLLSSSMQGIGPVKEMELIIS